MAGLTAEDLQRIIAEQNESPDILGAIRCVEHITDLDEFISCLEERLGISGLDLPPGHQRSFC